ncbi:hypothetical protein AX14_013425 [Amanita brunnescens Koide BX004]|nr:hypothetical protein AX14_013425 [Amanita brunnescens Koide BX004]
MNFVQHVYQSIRWASSPSGLSPSISYDSAALIYFSDSIAIDDRRFDLTRLMDWNYRNADPEDQDKISRDMVKIFHKMTLSRHPRFGTKYLYYKCVNITGVRHFNVTPELIYDCFLRTTNPRSYDHPRGISSFAFAFAAILAVRSLNTSHFNLRYNKTSPNFDLSPLYGANEMETNSIRMNHGRGMLWPDSFAEERLEMLPDSVPVLLVLWNRYHNYVAEQLWSYNEDNWEDPENLSPDQCLAQDEEIFHIARSITCIHFINVLRKDFLQALIGMPIAGPCAPVLDILYDVGSMTNDQTSCLSSVESYLLYSFSSFAPSSLASKIRFQQRNEASVDPDMRCCNRVSDLRCNKHDYFEDNDLAELLFDAIEEILKLRQAKQANVCTLNEFRQHLGLKPLQSFEEWNPEFANIARNVFVDINELELYPGLLCERSYGYGFGFGYTMTWGLIADIVTRIRCDPMFTSKFNGTSADYHPLAKLRFVLEHILTEWGYKDCTSSIDNGSSSFSNCPESMLQKFFRRTLPHNFIHDSNNVYFLFPFIVPGESKRWLDQEKYKFYRPKPLTVLSSLLTLLKKEPIALISSNVNKYTVGLMCKLLDLKDYGALSSQLSLASDIELLVDLILYVLHENRFPKHATPDITRKARRLMFTLLAQMPVTPKSLFITSVSVPDSSSNYVNMGGFGVVFKGKYKGKYVALKLLYRGSQGNDSLERDFCREVLAWRSLSHPYILPLLGIFERESQIFFVSPYMENGTLANWRKSNKPGVKEIRQRILEVADALRYIHSEGIVHGDMRGENVLLDASFHSQVADFGLTRHSDMTVTHSTATLSLNFAAPELFGIEDSARKRAKTCQTDVYAFGCLYYQIYFNAVPFAELSQFQIMRHLADGERPIRLEMPRMEDGEWDIIQRCWVAKPSVRLNVEDVVKTMASIVDA